MHISTDKPTVVPHSVSAERHAYGVTCIVWHIGKHCFGMVEHH